MIKRILVFIFLGFSLSGCVSLSQFKTVSDENGSLRVKLALANARVYDLERVVEDDRYVNQGISRAKDELLRQNAELRQPKQNVKARKR